ncbi:carbon-phosphorus lyase complex subunit PhnI [Opitutales bacterium ASA1]|uniref:carbon-phosphorus lyase complex subunit PhnI n=1 Tax=Congregicoccus parvus TaxID=3081749 RepID=UPI002B2DCAE9|nr:carbon-phosphorus lyase complex subunit PhnI [Opitutales bacterium ASA1]
MHEFTNSSLAVEESRRAAEAARTSAERERLLVRSVPCTHRQIAGQLRALVDKAMGEAGLWAPEHAALALKQCEGEAHEAVVVLRAFRQSLKRGYTSETIDTRTMFVERRISSAFREIPGGQILGPTRDYSQRMLESDFARESAAAAAAFLAEFEKDIDPTRLRAPTCFSKVTDLLRAEGLLRPVDEDESREVVDITRSAIRFPAPRSARLQALARAETGSIMALAYAGMRGQGGDHPTIGEVRVGLVAIRVADARGRVRSIGRIRVTESENISKIKVKKKDAVPYLSLGYGLCFGQNETKAICMGMLDRGMRIKGGDFRPATSDEFVLYHTDGADSWGSLRSLALPAYAEFQSELELLREAMARRAASRAQPSAEARV